MFPPAPRVERALGQGLHARFAAAMLRLLGWRVVLARPVPARCVIVIYPHTSNWDFVVGLLPKWMLGLELNFIGKHTLLAGPLGPLFARWGGIPVDRRASTGVIAQMAARFAEGRVCRLVIAPAPAWSIAAPPWDTSWLPGERGDGEPSPWEFATGSIASGAAGR